VIIAFLLLAATFPRLTDQAPRGAVKVATPGVQYRMNVASATSVPWIDANGWRFLRDPNRIYYYDVPAATVPLAMAEAYAYGIEAMIHPAGDSADSARMLDFLKQIDRPAMLTLANIGLIDDGSDATGEVMNLLSRRNLLFRVVKAPDPKLDLNLQPGKEEAADPFAYAQKVRQKLGDDKRLVRIYGSDVVLAHLTGDGGKSRLHLINYSNRKVIGLHVRLRGTYAKGTLAAFGVPRPAIPDYEQAAGATEFTVPEMGTYAVIDLSSR
jgi:hypothetical protein